jgi:hypothetical protein
MVKEKKNKSSSLSSLSLLISALTHRWSQLLPQVSVFSVYFDGADSQFRHRMKRLLDRKDDNEGAETSSLTLLILIVCVM